MNLLTRGAIPSQLLYDPFGTIDSYALLLRLVLPLLKRNTIFVYI